MSTIIVTGGAGFIRGNFIHYYLKHWGPFEYMAEEGIRFRMKAG